MKARAKLELLAPAQRELEEIARVYLKLVGRESARRITDRILASLENLRTYPHMGVAVQDRELAAEGYRMLVCGNYLCFYRPIGDAIFVYHIVDGRANYPKLLSDLQNRQDDGI